MLTCVNSLTKYNKYDIVKGSYLKYQLKTQSMNVLLIVFIIALAILAVVRIVLVINNPTRKEKFFGIISSLSVLLPATVLFLRKSYYFSSTNLSIKVFILIACFIFCLFVFYSNYKEYVSYKNA